MKVVCATNEGLLALDPAAEGLAFEGRWIGSGQPASARAGLDATSPRKGLANKSRS